MWRKLSPEEKRKVDHVLLGFADAFAPSYDRIGPFKDAVAAPAYKVGLKYGRDMLNDADKTNLSIGDYIDTALEEVGVVHEET